MTPPPLLRLEGFTKRFPGVTALQEVSLEVQEGEILGLLGENGAGKSTLLKIVSGAQRPDQGTIAWRGEAVSLATPHAAQRLGIVTIDQEFTLVPDLSVAENAFSPGWRASCCRLGLTAARRWPAPATS